jgi:hypothetical protein
LKEQGRPSMKGMKGRVLVFFLVLLQSSLWGQDSSQTTKAYWSYGKFSDREKERISRKAQIVTDKTIFFEFNNVSCYGHALLDGLVPLYAMLKAENLLDKSVNVAIRIPSDQMKLPTTRNILQLVKDVFPFKNIYILNGKKKVFFESIVLDEYKKNYEGFYKTFPKSHNYIKQLKDFGIQDNIVFQDSLETTNIVKEFVEFIITAYKINPAIIKNRVLIADRSSHKKISNLTDLINWLIPWTYARVSILDYVLPHRNPNRKISNLKQLVKQLESKGYDVQVVDFEKLSIKEQIVQTIQAQYLIGTYGSNMVNAVFLRPEANVVILWHKFAKYFWSRKYCIIHSAFLSAGVKLIEFDKADYDVRDFYATEVSNPDFFYHKGTQIFLKPEKTSLEEMLKYPLPAMYDLTTVNMYIPPEEVVQLLEKSKSLNNEPCKIMR